MFRRLWRRDRDLDEEMRAHLEMAATDRVERGEAPGDARQAALREFGNAGLIRQRARESERGWWTEQVLIDLRISVRRLLARPGTTLSAVVLLALAIGVTTAVFAVADALVLRPMPFPDADRIDHVWMRSKTGGRSSVSPAVFESWRRLGVFEAVEGVSADDTVVEAPAGPAVRASAWVTPGVFAMLGVQPVRGRLFNASDVSGSDRVLISETVWRGLFNSTPDIVGSSVTLNGETATIVGVLPPDFRFPRWNSQVWRPIDFFAPPNGQRPLPEAHVKFRADVPRRDALSAATKAAHEVDGSTPNLWAEGRSQSPERQAGTQYSEISSRLLVGGVTFLFIVLCANACGVLLARFTSRHHDYRLCAALGATRARLLWQAGLESTLLGVAGCVIGTMLAWLLIAWAATLFPQEFLTRSLNPVNMDRRAVVASVVLGFTATLLAGWLPAWLAGRSTPFDRMLDRTTTESRAGRFVARGLLVVELTLACALLVSASLLIRSFVNLQQVDPGFDPDGHVAVWVEPTSPSVAQAAERAADALHTLPGVTTVIRSRGIPMFGGDMHWGEWQPLDGVAGPVPVETYSYRVPGEWFRAYGLRLLQGRFFGPDEAPEHVILSESLASALWPAQSAVGRSFRWGNGSFQVVGVVKDLRTPVRDLETNFSEVYLPARPGMVANTLGVHCPQGCPSEGLIRQSLQTATPDVRVIEIKALERLYAEELAQPRLMAATGMVLAALALSVAAGGLFGVMSHIVRRRRREFGIRLVLGSSPGGIRWVVLREALAMVTIGVCAGATVAWGTTAALRSLLYGVTPADPISWVGVIGALAAATLAGAGWPLRHASRIDPATLLREE